MPRVLRIGGAPHRGDVTRRTPKLAAVGNGFRAWLARQPDSGRVQSTKISRNSLLVFWDQRRVGGGTEARLSPAVRVARGQRGDLVMAEDRLHVVFGTGQVGSALERTSPAWVPVRAVSRNRPATLAEGVDWRAADAADPEAAADAAKGATVVYQCLNAPYTQWPELFPPLQRGVLEAAERTGALLVTLENLYGYGPTGGKPMTEDLPLAATTVKGRARAAMTEELPSAADRSGPDSHRPSVGLLRAGRHRDRPSASGSSATPWPAAAPTSSATLSCPTPTATSPTSPPAWPRSGPMTGRPARCGTSPARKP